jgi:hypothetical protein
VALALLASSAAAQKRKEKADSQPTPETRALEAKLFSTLSTVINRGANLYNRDDPAGCYRLYEGNLMTMRPLLDHRPDLQKAITTALASAERDPQVFRRAFTLRTVMDKIRSELNPRKDRAKLLAEDKKPPEKKKPGPAPEVKKKPGPAAPEVKKKPPEPPPFETLPVKPKLEDGQKPKEKQEEKKQAEKDD